MLCAGLDGVKRKIDPGNPVDEDLYHLSASKRKEYGVRELPGSLKELIEHLQTDYMFGKTVFPQDLLEKYEELKLDEHLQTSLRPSPYEFYRYMDACTERASGPSRIRRRPRSSDGEMAESRSETREYGRYVSSPQIPPRELASRGSFHGIHSGLPRQLVCAALGIPEDHDARDLRRRLDHRWRVQVPTGLRRLIGPDDLRRGPGPAELAAAVVRFLEPNREREPRLFRHDDRRAGVGPRFRPPPRIHAEGGVHGGHLPQSRHLVGT